MTQIQNEAPPNDSAGAVTRMLIATAMLLSPLWLLPLVFVASQSSVSYNLQSFANLDKFLICLAAFAAIALIGLIWLIVSLPSELPRVSNALSRMYGSRMLDRPVLLAIVLMLTAHAGCTAVASIAKKMAVTTAPAATTAAPAPAPAPAPATMVATKTLRRFMLDVPATLTPRQADEIEAKLAAFQTQTGHTLVVFIVQDTGGQRIETFARTFFNRWGTRPADRDDGIFVVVARQEHQVRIELGRGFSALAPETPALVDGMTQAFARRDYYGGISACVDALIAKAS